MDYLRYSEGKIERTDNPDGEWKSLSREEALKIVENWHPHRSDHLLLKCVRASDNREGYIFKYGPKGRDSVRVAINADQSLPVDPRDVYKYVYGLKIIENDIHARAGEPCFPVVFKVVEILSVIER